MRCEQYQYENKMIVLDEFLNDLRTTRIGPRIRRDCNSHNCETVPTHGPHGTAHGGAGPLDRATREPTSPRQHTARAGPWTRGKAVVARNHDTSAFKVYFASRARALPSGDGPVPFGGSTLHLKVQICGEGGQREHVAEQLGRRGLLLSDRASHCEWASRWGGNKWQHAKNSKTRAARGHGTCQARLPEEDHKEDERGIARRVDHLERDRICELDHDESEHRGKHSKHGGEGEEQRIGAYDLNGVGAIEPRQLAEAGSDDEEPRADRGEEILAMGHTRNQVTPCAN